MYSKDLCIVWLQYRVLVSCTAKTCASSGYSIEYWFRCMDLDGDGVISMYEMEYFYEEQMQKMEALGIEKLPFEDCLCQVSYLYKVKYAFVR